MAASFGKRNMRAPAASWPKPVAAAAAAPMPRAPVIDSLPTLRTPVVTIFLLLLLGIIYMLEVRYAPVPFLSARTLATYGAIEGDLVFRHGEWWRLFTASLLHASAGHLIGNGVVLAIVGFMLEPLIGPRWFAGLFAIGGLGGAVGSLLLDAPDVPGVGASGAIMAVLGAAFICGSSARSGPKGRRMQTWALRLILPALIPMAADSHTDYACHLGGLLTGLAMGVFLLASWTRGEDRPAFGNAGAVIGLVSLLFGLFAFVLFGAKPGNAAVIANAASGLIPDAEMPSGFAIDTDHARALLDKYPHDPRAHMFRGFAFLKDDHDLADAEEQFRQALSTKDLLAARLTPEFGQMVTVLLAVTVSYENRPDEARAIAAPVCSFAQAHMDDLYDTMHDRQVCP